MILEGIWRECWIPEKELYLIYSHIYTFFLTNYIAISTIVYNICTVYNDVHIHIYIIMYIYLTINVHRTIPGMQKMIQRGDLGKSRNTTCCGRDERLLALVKKP
jgi:hypothetical protein